MFNKPICAQPARLDGSATLAGMTGIAVATDPQRAPITFGWCAFDAQGRARRYFHTETVYRLDWVTDAAAGSTLAPNRYFGLAKDTLRTQLRQREKVLLPSLPQGHRWVGPEIIDDVAPQFPRASDPDAPARTQKLLFASALARRILQERRPS